MAKIVSKLNPQWVTQTRTDLRQFLKAAKFPHPRRDGQRGSAFDYPEWLIMLIAVLGLRCKVKTCVGIHRLALQYGPLLTPDPALKPSSESHLNRSCANAYKICHTPGKPATFILQFFPVPGHALD
jgi:hypothetical protein